MSHAPVMLKEVLEVLRPQDGEILVDGTFGAGGYTRGILEAAPGCRVVAIDRDPDAAKRAAPLCQEWGEQIIFARGCFGDVADLLEDVGIAQIDGLVLDLGVSSFQLDEAQRGFSFRYDGPLDMRMDYEQGESAADLVNTADEKELADIIYNYGEERHSRRIARKIVETRQNALFVTTGDLAEVVRSVLPSSPKDRNDPATRTFQALRIAVNDELGELERALQASLSLLKPGGRLVVVSFHSLEDRIVKRFLKERCGKNTGSRYRPDAGVQPALFELECTKALRPSDGEIALNMRARSARLRYGVRTAYKEPAA